MAALAVLEADEGVHPAVGLAAVAEIVDELAVAARLAEGFGVFFKIGGEVEAAAEIAEEALTDELAVGREDVETQRQACLAVGHRGGLNFGAEAAGRQDREREEVASAQ